MLKKVEAAIGTWYETQNEDITVIHCKKSNTIRIRIGSFTNPSMNEKEVDTLIRDLKIIMKEAKQKLLKRKE